VCNVLERVMAATGLIKAAKIDFGQHNNVQFGGVLLAVPALVSQGLKEAMNIYEPFLKAYYGIESVFMLLGFMSLLRIKSPEQLKQHSPGELGKVIGLDRVPEAKTLRRKLNLIVAQKKAGKFQQALLKKWTLEQPCLFFYIDGHVRVYNGYKANLGRKYVSRQKLCLAGTVEYWVNDEMGLPFMCVIGELNEKLREAIETDIVPQLLADIPADPKAGDDSQTPLFTLIFDREAYEPSFFARLWREHRIAVITYRKNVKDKWDENDFYEIETKVIGNIVNMLVCEKKTELNGFVFREIRKLSDDGHQTVILTTNLKLPIREVVGKMFSRWSQENFFRYLLGDFNFDRLLQYGTEELSGDIQVVNPAYSSISNQIKKTKEKKARLEAQLFQHLEKDINQPMSKMSDLFVTHSKTTDKIETLKSELDQMLIDRKQIPARIKLKEMDNEKRYNKLKTESKQFINIIRMIAYRAETALLNLIRPVFRNTEKEGRMVIKSILTSDVDLKPDYTEKNLTITLHTQSNPRSNKAAFELCILLTETQTVYPGTDLKMIFKTHPNHFAKGQEF
jgi:Transposase protein